MVGLGRRNCAYAAAIILLITGQSTVNAQTTSDLYKVYSIPEQTAYDAQVSKLSELTKEYNDKSSEYNYAVEYNDIVDKLDIPKLSSDCDKLSESLEADNNYILDNGIDMDYQDIMSAMSDYRDKLTTYTKKKMLLDKYSGVDNKEIPAYDFDSMAESLIEAQDEVQSLYSNSDIGDIDSLYNFLQATYTVKRKFDGTGLLLKAVPDTGVLSVFNGTVVYSDRDDETGETIKIDSGDGIIITYQNLTARYVQQDDNITQYQKIATTSQDLYITLEINGKYYDLNKLYGG